MPKRIVRVTRVWDIPVTAEYGDHDQSLMDKADPEASGNPVEHRTLLPHEDYPPVPAPEPGETT